ncbi:MAG: hypothetical protein ACYCSN_20470 [Acidobacteriaceae bacterium]
MRTHSIPACLHSRDWCGSRSHQMPRKHLRVLPSLTRPSLYSGD